MMLGKVGKEPFSCAGCAHRFPVNLHTRTYPDGELLYIVCPRCSRRHPYAWATRKALDLRAQLAEARRSGARQMAERIDAEMRGELTKLDPKDEGFMRALG
jgi:DNA-directed RNA polymerase subunit RPC12/RpoP